MASQRDRFEELTRDLDMVVFRLERAGRADESTASANWGAERRRLRRDLEQLRDRLEEAVRAL